MTFKAKTTITLSILFLILAPAVSHSFQVLPRISDVDRKLTQLGDNPIIGGMGQWLIGNVAPMLKNPVHEAITLKAKGCDAPSGQELNCITNEAIGMNQMILYGVRWPDDPPFLLNSASPPRILGCDPRVTLRSTAQPKCWIGLFSDASKTAKKRTKKNRSEAAFGPGDYLLYRTHFGDLQFFHSMATHNGELAENTVRKMKMWAKFLWGLSTQLTPKDRYIRTLEDNELGTYFPGDFTATNLLATGIVEVREYLDAVAIGALLHMIQDSFSNAHAERKPESGAVCQSIPQFKQPGIISRFYSYADQKSSSHDHEDTFDSLGIQTLVSSPNVVDVSKIFLDYWKEKTPWPEVEKYFDCAFSVENPKAEAGPGRFSD